MSPPSSAAQLAVVIPTRDRAAVLAETLDRLAATAAAEPIELFVVDDGSGDDTPELLRARLPGLPWPAQALRQEGNGPARARNLGMRTAGAEACLLMGDDTRPREGMIARHVRFHADRPEPTAALLGHVVPAAPLDASSFIRWLHTDGVQFGYGALDPSGPISADALWTANVSLKRRFALDGGGFDESFPDAACEDAELGLRLARRGLELRYDPEAIAEHYHPTDLAQTLERMNAIGVAYRTLCRLAPEMPEPTRPAARHRLKAAALWAAMRTGVGGQRTRTATWRFLCDEVQREAYWDVGTPGERPRIGAALARLALADEKREA